MTDTSTKVPFASSKKNAEFHELFPEVGSDDYLAEDYSAALQREILLHGRLYVSSNHLAFHANIFGYITHELISFTEVASIEKSMTALIIPNGIIVTTTKNAQYTFASLLTRDSTYDVICSIWKGAKPDISSVPVSMRDGRATGREAEAKVDDTEKMDDVVETDLETTKSPEIEGHASTQCACGKRNEHFSEVANEYEVPGTPETIYNLMFKSQFIKDFMINEQGLRDMQMSDWKPTKTDSKGPSISRTVSYIKPLSALIGPKEAKCEITEETQHADFDDYVTTLTTTRTPDVPSGDAFSVQTRTCIMWAGADKTTVIVTTNVDWTGTSLVSGTIEKSAIEGQKTYHRDLEEAMRAYIQAHPNEVAPPG